ncbi:MULTISPECIES: hypothetical protein [unclassified Mesorhizobium]|uniref:hypothetical protein n=1 Tax=unclassified Mesorhizobium TaxID=325217 RepID=UPI0015E30102|nr:MULTISPECIES: hypothetical protein [unclassified Mesorhizobium]MBZ9973871.1 hypothetical protein [Mesorhizobium sp. BR-1-1-10]
MTDGCTGCSRISASRINAAAIDHYEIGRSAVADVAATAFHLHKHIVPSRLPQHVDRILRHENRKGTNSLPVKRSHGIFPQMNDEPIRLPDGITPVPRERARVLGRELINGIDRDGVEAELALF